MVKTWAQKDLPRNKALIHRQFGIQFAKES